MSEKAMKPCPFCGRASVTKLACGNNNYVCCLNCHAIGLNMASLKEGVELWNRRVIFGKCVVSGKARRR